MIVIFALLGVVLIGVFVTRQGIGTSPDSLVYIAGARNLVEGRGFSLPEDGNQAQAITHHAPLYAGVLALVGMSGVDPMQAARWLGALLFGANIGLVGWLLLKQSGAVAAVLGAALMLASPVMVEIHSMAWTEGLFIFLSLLSVLWLERGVAGSAGYILLAAGALGLGFLTRYAGAALLPAGVLAVFLFSQAPFWRRVGRSVALFGLLSMLPGATWMLRNLLVAGTASNRELLFHPPGREQLLSGMNTAAAWLGLPDSLPAMIKVIPLAALAGLVLVYLWRRFSSKTPNSAQPALQPAILALYILSYGVFLLLSLTFFDANTPLDGRILAPVFAWSVLLVVETLGGLLQAYKTGPLVRWMSAGLAVLLLLAYAFPSAAYAATAYRVGLGFNRIGWQRSGSMAAVRSLSATTGIYSNAPEAIYFQTGRMALRIPSTYQSANRRPNPDFLSEMSAMGAQLQAGQAVVVWFDAGQRGSLPEEAELVREFSLQPLAEAPDGTILGRATSP